MTMNYKPSDTGIRHWEQRTSERGNPYWVWSKSMPAFDPNFSASVFYIYPSKDDAENSTEFGGTGFLFWVPSDIIETLGFTYAVTCWHVIRDNPDPIIRINTRDGKYDTIQTKSDDWTRHPNGDDVAISRISFGRNSNYFYGQFMHRHVPTDDFVKAKGIHPGDEVVMIGRFRVHAGKKRNLPAFMFGYISMMPDEPIYNNATGLEQESYLVEMRSISGFSGSPVVLWIPPLALRPNSTDLIPESYIRLLGVCWGYITVPERAKDDYGQEHKLKLNSSMAAVVPIQKVMELIDSEEQMEFRKRENDALKKRIEDSGVSTSGHSKEKESDEHVLTKEEFEDALRKIARPLKKDDQEKKGKEE